MSRNDCWVFGYGSLIWRVDFPFAESHPAVVHGLERRFWQGSTDHRGRPGAPGRVVTLIESPNAICWGMAYRLASNEKNTVLAQLDYREKGGYLRRDLDIQLTGRASATAVTWVAAQGNPNYLGEAGLHDIARQVQSSSGPSGENAEYVLRLEESIRAAGAEDSHVFEIARLLRGGGELPA